MPFDFSGKRAIVTGGANGIGWEAACSLAAGGAEVCIFDLDREQPDAAAKKLGGRGFVVDIPSRESIEAGFAQAGAPDIVIANAGIGGEAELDATSSELWQRTIAVNLTGTFHTIQTAALAMKPRRSGSIVLTASTNSYD